MGLIPALAGCCYSPLAYTQRKLPTYDKTAHHFTGFLEHEYSSLRSAQIMTILSQAICMSLEDAAPSLPAVALTDRQDEKEDG